MGEYDQKTLRRLQLTLLDMVKDIDAVCRENDIKYYIAYGSALGAIRHHGFIPWDDDMDICVCREDYDRFFKCMEKKYSDKYDILNVKNTPKYAVAFYKISKKGTKFVEMVGAADGYEQGIFIDVFPLDYTSSDEKERKRLAKKEWFWSHLLILRSIKEPIIPNSHKGIKRKIMEIGCKSIYEIMNLLHISKEWIYGNFLKTATSYVKDKEYMTDYCAMRPEKVLNKTSDLFPVRYVEFEDCKLPVPNNTDVYLKNMYGNYMELPKPEDRHNHFASKIDFGD